MNKALENRLGNYRRIMDDVHGMQEKIENVIDTVADLVDAEDPCCGEDRTNGTNPLYVQQRMVEDEEGNCSTLSVTLTPAKFIKIMVCPADDPDDQWALSLTLRETDTLIRMIDDAVHAAGKNAGGKNVWGEF